MLLYLDGIRVVELSVCEIFQLTFSFNLKYISKHDNYIIPIFKTIHFSKYLFIDFVILRWLVNILLCN